MSTVTGKPQLNAKAITDAEGPMREVLKCLNEMHGVGAVLQTNKGGHSAVRLNLDSGNLERYDGKQWIAITTGI
jgi:hypothetical protein